MASVKRAATKPVVKVNERKIATAWFNAKYSNTAGTKEWARPLTKKIVDGAVLFTTAVTSDSWKTSRAVFVKVVGENVERMKAKEYDNSVRVKATTTKKVTEPKAKAAKAAKSDVAEFSVSLNSVKLKQGRRGVTAFGKIVDSAGKIVASIDDQPEAIVANVTFKSPDVQKAFKAAAQKFYKNKVETNLVSEYARELLNCACYTIATNLTKPVPSTKVWKKGMKVSWIGAGKFTRLEGMKGKTCFGTIAEVRTDEVVVDVKHRKLKDAMFKNLQSVVPISSLL